jgi:hypothetical protein
MCNCVLPSHVTAVSLVIGLGVEEKQFLHEIPILLHVSSYCDVGPNTNCNGKFEMTSLFVLAFYGKF